MYRMFIHTQAPCSNGLGTINWGQSKTVRFPRKVAECLTKLPEIAFLKHFRFRYRDFFFIAFLVSTDLWWQPD